MLGSAVRRAALSLALLVALVLASAASAAPLPGAVADGGNPKAGKNVLVRPKQIVYTGDGSGFLAGPGKAGRHPKPSNLKWSSWTKSAAQGSGANFVDDCVPDCADGSYAKSPVTIKLYRPRKLAGFEVFTRMTVHYPASASPLTHKHVDTFKVQSSGRHQLFWQFPT